MKRIIATYIDNIEVNKVSKSEGLYKELEKDIIITRIKGCYDNNLYDDSDIFYITKDTSKEKEMIQYLEEKDYEIF